jgi:hypothetical protein
VTKKLNNARRDTVDNNTAIIRYQGWIDIYREWADSGMTKRDFCREKNIREKRFYYYQRLIRNIAAESVGLPASNNEKHPEIVRLPVRGSESSSMIQFRLNGAELSLPENVPTAFLSKLLEAAGHGTR